MMQKNEQPHRKAPQTIADSQRKTEKAKLITTVPAACLLSILCNALWGSAMSVIKFGYRLFAIDTGHIASIILFAGIRFTLAGILVILEMSISRKKPQIPQKRDMGMIVCLAMLQTILQYLFFYVGVANTTGVKGSIFLSTTTFFAVFMSCVVFRLEKLRWNKLTGCVIGTAGVVLIYCSSSGLELGGFSFLGEGFVMLSALSYSLSSVMIGIFSKKADTKILCGYQFLMGGIVLTVIGLLFGGRLNQVTAGGILALVYLAAVSAVAYTIWGILLNYHPLSKIAVFNFTNPLVGVILAALLLHETDSIGPQMIVSLILICSGIWLTNKEFRSRAKRE